MSCDPTPLTITAIPTTEVPIDKGSFFFHFCISRAAPPPTRRGLIVPMSTSNYASDTTATITLSTDSTLAGHGPYI